MPNQEARNYLSMLLMVVSVMAAPMVSATETDPMAEAAIIERIRPIGNVHIIGQESATPKPAAASEATASTATAASSSSTDGKAAYSNCAACHDNGVLGAPKPGDKADWKSRIAQGMDTLNEHAIKGFTGKKGTMPPKGGSSLSDDDVKAVVKYMVDSSK